MPPITVRPVGAPIWIELSSTDPEESVRFYRAVLGTAATEPDPDLGGYRTLLHGDALVAGLMAAQNEEQSAWSVYLLTADIAATLALVEPNGGQILVRPTAVGDLGTMAFARDPSGAAVGLWQPGSHRGMGVQNEPGTPTWFELHATSGYRETITFYRQVFGWDIHVLSDSDEFRMVTLGADPDAHSGIFDASVVAPPGTPSAWHVYFEVLDADATATVVRAAGGRLLDGPLDTPFGRLSHAIDSTGAAFVFLSRPRSAEAPSPE